MDKKKALYNTLKDAGLTENSLGTFGQFSLALDKLSNRQAIYNTMIDPAVGFTPEKLGSFEQFESYLMNHKAEKPIEEKKVDIPTQIFGGLGPMGSFSSMGRVPESNEQLDKIETATSDILKGIPKGLGQSVMMTVEGLYNANLQASRMMTDDPKIQKDLDDITKMTYRFANERRDYIENLLPISEENKGNFFIQDVPEAIGQALGFGIVGSVGRSAGLFAKYGPTVSGMLTASIAGSAAEFQELGAEAFEATDDLSTAKKASLIGLPIGATEGLPLGRFFKKLDKVSKTPVRKLLIDAIKEGSEEYIQELTQTMAENFTAQELYDESREIMDGAYRGGGAGFFAGFALNLIGASVGHRMNRRNERKKAEETRNIILEHFGNLQSEINANSRIWDIVKNPELKSKDEVINRIGDEFSLTEEQKIKFNDLLVNNEEAIAIKDGLFKTSPELLNEKDYLNGAILEAIKSPKLFEQTYGFAVPEGLQNSFIGQVSNFIRDEGLLNKVEEHQNERGKSIETVTKEKPLFEKVSRETTMPEGTDYDNIFFQSEAYHGSPHKFDKFSLDKIGTGEGAQSYGYGLYFSSKEEIGKYYAKVLTNPQDYDEPIIYKTHKVTKDDAYLEYFITQNINPIDKFLITDDMGVPYDLYETEKEANKWISENTQIPERKKANLYKVTLWEGKEQNLLPWNDSLTEDQIKLVKEKIKEKAINFDVMESELIAETGENYGVNGSALYGNLSEYLGSDALASKFLQEIGFDGITYYGYSSGEINYVVFDDNAIKINEAIQFQKKEPSGIRTYDNILSEALQSTNPKESAIMSGSNEKMSLQGSYQSRELLNQLESKGIFDSSVKPFLDWAVQYSGNPNISILNSQSLLSNGELLGNRPGVYRYDSQNKQHKIGINKDFATKNDTDLYNTIAHEITHAATVRGLKENRQFRSEATELMNDFRNTIGNPKEFAEAFESVEEFMAYAMSNTSGIRDIMSQTEIKNSTHSNFLQRLISLLKNFFSNVLGLKPTSYYRGLELILARNLGYTPQNQFSFNEIGINDNTFEKVEASLDKSFMITNSDMMDPRVIRATAELLGKEKGLQLKDYYTYIKTFKYADFQKQLFNSEEWNKRAKFFYDKNYRNTVNSLDEFKDKVIKNVWNLANTLDRVPYLQLKIANKSYDNISKPTPFYSIREYPDIYTDADGNTKISMHEHLKLFDLLPEIGQLLNVKFEPMMVDKVETQEYYNDTYLGNSFEAIASSQEEGKNDKYAKIFGAHGYIYLGNWADKKTIVVLKPSKAIDKNIIKQIGDTYQKRILSFAEQALRNGYMANDQFVKGLGDEQVDQLLKNNENIENALKVIGHPLYNYIQENASQSKIVRFLLQDLSLGGRIVNNQLVSSLFDITRPETYDSLLMYKRAWLVSPTRYIEEVPAEIKEVLSNLPVKKHGMRLTDKGLMTSNLILNVKNISKEERITIDGKDYSLYDLLINSLGTARLDGPIFYVKGGLDVVWDKLHGVVKKGVKKGWRGSSYLDADFRNPYYEKGAYHQLPVSSPLAKWMMENEITMLVSSSTAKVNSYPIASLKQLQNKDNLKNYIFQFPFKELQRNGEKSGVKNDATGLPQIFVSTFATKANKSFVDKGWNQAIDDILNYALREAENKIADINYASVVEHIKDQGLSGTSEYDKSIAGVAVELLLRETDKIYNDLQNAFPFVQSKEAKKETLQRLNDMKDRITGINEELGNKLGAFFHEPFFSKGLTSYMGRIMSDLINLKVPSTYAVLSPDLGVLAPSRIEYIKSHINSSLRNEERLIKPYIAAKQKFASIDKRIKDAINDEEKNQILLERNTATEELDKYEDNIDYYENQLARFYDDNGNLNLRTEKATGELSKELLKYVSETGHLNDGYVMISKDIADEYGLKVGDNLATAMIPVGNQMSAGASTIAAILPESELESGAIIMNSEYAQTVLGKDYDIDTTLIIPKSKAFSDEGWDGFIQTLSESYKKHREDILKFYRKEVDSELTDKDVYSKKAKLDFITKYFPESNFKEGSLFNPLSDAWNILEKFNKQIGLIVNRKKTNTFKSSMNWKTKIGDQVLNVNHQQRYRTYMLLDVLTHHMVDMPTDTGSFHYDYDDMIAFDHDNGTDFYNQENKKQAKINIRAIQNFEKFLFTYALKLNDTKNLDDRENLREYEDVLKYFGYQQDINSLLQSKNYPKLLEVYENHLKERYPKIKSKWLNTNLSIAKEYLENLTFDNLLEPPLNRLANGFNLNQLPNITTSESDYLLTQGNMINSMLEKPAFKSIKSIYDLMNDNKEVLAAINRIPKSGTIIPGLNIDSNSLLGRMFYMTLGKPELHELKAKLISLIYPVDQSTKAQSQINKVTSGPGIFPDNIFQKTNEFTYPLLFDILLKNRSFKFKGKAKEAQIGNAKIERTLDDQLKVIYNGSKWNATELLNDQTIAGKNALKYIKDELGSSPIARYNLSTLMSLGGSNTNLTDKENLAIDLLNRELPKYNDFEKGLFWFSLLGKPDAKPKYPLNLVSPEKSSTKNYHSQSKLLHILGKVDDPVAHRFLNLYAQEFNNNYVGKTLKEIQSIQRILDNEIMDSNDEIFFQSPNKEIVKEVEKIDKSIFHPFKMIDDIIRKQPKEIKANTENAIGGMVNLLNGNIEDITVADVTNSLSAYVTENLRDVNVEAIAFTQAEAIEKNIKLLEAREDSQDRFIKHSIKQYRELKLEQVKKETKDLSKRLKKRLNLSKEINKKINELSETNPFEITDITETMQGNYIITTPKGIFESFDDLLDVYSIKQEERLLYKSAFQYQVRYGLNNIRTLQNMLSYLEKTAQELSVDFGRMDVIESMLKKYSDLIERFKGLGYDYFPRMVKARDMESIIKQIKEKEAIDIIKERVAEARNRKSRGESYNEKYDIADDKINELVDDYLEEIKSHIVKNQYGDYIYTFQMKRSINELTNGMYLNDTMRPHTEHAKMFNKMLHTDLYIMNNLIYEFEAAKVGISKQTLMEMQTWHALGARARHMMTTRVTLDKLKEGNKVKFYYNGDLVKGVYKSSDNKYMYLNYDNDLYHEDILKQRNEFAKKHDQILRVRNKKATDTQVQTLKELYLEGHTDLYPNDQLTIKDANDEILVALQKKIDNPNTWGRFRKDRIYTREYENGIMTNKLGVEKYYDPVLPGVATILKSLFSGTFLGGTGGAVANHIDAQMMLVTDFGIREYTKTSWNARYFRKEFMIALKRSDLKQFEDNLKKFIDPMTGKVIESKLTFITEQEKYAGAIAAKYLVEAGETRPIYEVGKERALERVDMTSTKGWKNMLAKGMLEYSSIAKLPRNVVERRIRVSAAYMYGYKAVVIDKISDPKVIEQVIEHGVKRTQALYDAMYRKLGEFSEWGSFGMQFSHYNTFMLQSSIKEYEQMNNLGQPINIKNFFSNTIYDENGKAHGIHDSVDPHILGKLKFRFWYNTIGRTMELLFPGIRAGSPLFRVFNLIIYNLAMGLSGNWDADDDGWDLRDLAFSLMSFYVGTGFTLPIQAVYNYFTEDNDVLPVNNRVTNPAQTIYEAIGGESGRMLNYNAMMGDDFQLYFRPSEVVKSEAYNFAKGERALLGFNAIGSQPRKFSSMDAQKFQSKDVFEKIFRLSPIPIPGTEIGEDAEIFIPVLNMFKYHK